jgi:hypothetical protein
MDDPLFTKPTTGIADCCARCERPRCRATNQRDELSAL